jgi:hypothetical protein
VFWLQDLRRTWRPEWAEGCLEILFRGIWKLIDSGISGGSQKRLYPVAAPEQLTEQTSDDKLLYEIPEIDTGVANSLGLIITRLDSEEASDPVGAYTIALQPSHGP